MSMTNKPVPRKLRLNDFLELPSYPGQRDTEKHAEKLRHSDNFDRENLTLGFTIVLAEWRGKTYVMDGNTQRLLHQQGYIVLPNELLAIVYFPATEAAFHTLYRSFNGKDNVKTSPDTMFSAFRLNGIKTRSAPFKNAQLTSALSFAEGARLGLRRAAKLTDLNGVVKTWKDQLDSLDKRLTDVTKSRAAWNAGIEAAILLTYREDPVLADFFWQRYYADRGVAGLANTPWNRLWHKADVESQGSGGSREVTTAVLEYALYAISKVDNSDLKRGNGLTDYISEMPGNARWHRISMATYLEETRRAVKRESKAAFQVVRKARGIGAGKSEEARPRT